MNPRGSPSRLSAIAAAVFALGALLPACGQENIPPQVRNLSQASALDIQLRTDTARDVHLRLDKEYATQDLGDRLTTEQLEQLDTIRAEAPDKYQILASFFPSQIAEFLLRAPSRGASPDWSIPPADDPIQRLLWEIAADYIGRPQNRAMTESQLRARADFVRASLQSLPAQPAPIQQVLERASHYEDPDFGSSEKTGAFLGLQGGYSPYRRVAMSIAGDTLRVDGWVITGHLGAVAAAAGQSPEQYAYGYYNRYSQALAYWRTSQITGNAYAGSIRRFLNDPRLADFTPEEVARAYWRVFGRDLGTDLEADRIAARLGHPVTYSQIRAQQPAKD